MIHETLHRMTALALGALLASGCADGGDLATARVRVIHLSPDAPAVDVFVDQGATPAFAGLAFQDSTSYATLPAGPHDFDVAPSGESAADAVLRVGGLDLGAGGSYTAVAYGELAGIAALALTDELEGIGPGDVRLRAVHTASKVGEVDIWDIGDPFDPQPLWQNVGFGDVGDALDVPAGGYALGIDTDDDGHPELKFLVPALPEGTAANVFAVNDTSGAVFLLAQLQDGSVVRIDPVSDVGYLRALHLSPDAPAVDIHVDGATSPVVSELGFREGTGWLALPAGDHAIDVTPTGAGVGASVLHLSAFPIAPGGVYTVTALGTVADLAAMPMGPKPLTLSTIVEDTSDPGPGSFRVDAVLHAAPAFDTVDVRNETAGTSAVLFGDVAYGALAAGLPMTLPVGAYDIGIDADRDGTSDVVFAVPALPAGTVVDLFASSDASGAPALVAYLDDCTVVTL